jgi:two-component system alkaline phosphatase synthesis response regulator PhoP
MSTKHQPLILVVEDEEDMRNGLQHNLEFEGYRTMTAATGEEGLQKALSKMADLVILDVMLPGRNGFDVLRIMRERGVHTPVILLTSKGLESDKLEGFARGADDYVTKPFSIGELLARLRAVLHRATPNDANQDSFRLGEVVIDFDARKVMRAQEELILALKEFEILELLVRLQGQIVSRERMLKDVWGHNPENLPETRTVDNHIAKLRHKIGSQHIETVPKQGYRLVL